MALPLELYLLGPPLLRCAGKSPGQVRRKAVALLAYLALNKQSHSRDTLATLFWPNYGQSKARANLRRTISILNQAVGEKILLSEQDTLRLNPEPAQIDVDRFRHLARGCGKHQRDQPCESCVTGLREAAALYRNDFLFGFTLPDCRDFDEWQFGQDELLRGEFMSVLRHLIRANETTAQEPTALGWAKRLVSLDPLDESSQRVLIRMYAERGQRTAAIRQYRECLRLLQEELSTEPEKETVSLYNDLQAGRLGRTAKRKGERDSEPLETVTDELRLVTVLAIGLALAGSLIGATTRKRFLKKPNDGKAEPGSFWTTSTVMCRPPVEWTCWKYLVGPSRTKMMRNGRYDLP